MSTYDPRDDRSTGCETEHVEELHSSTLHDAHLCAYDNEVSGALGVVLQRLGQLEASVRSLTGKVLSGEVRVTGRLPCGCLATVHARVAEYPNGRKGGVKTATDVTPDGPCAQHPGLLPRAVAVVR